MDLKKEIYKMAGMTKGRISQTQVFSDFLAYSALCLSIRTDPVHMERRQMAFAELKGRYSDDECRIFHQTLQLLCSEVARNVEAGCYRDLLSVPYSMTGMCSKALKQNFSPPDIAQLMAAIAIPADAPLPENGYFTLSDDTCGSGTLLLGGAEQLARSGYNPCEQLVVQAADLDIRCVHMAYLQLSLYGIPAVVIHGDCITLQEYDRWYTPVYLWRKWVWREPMLFGNGGRTSNLALKMIDEPIYGAFLRLNQKMDEPNIVEKVERQVSK